MMRIRRQLRFTMEDIGENKMYFTIGLIQVVIGTLIMCYVLNLIALSIASFGQINRLRENEFVYGLKDMSSGQQFDQLMNTAKGLKELQNFRSGLEAKGIKQIVINGSQDISMEKRLLEKGLLSLAKDSYDEKASFETLRISPVFFDFFGIEIDDKMKEKIFSNGKYIILGNDYGKCYQQGDKLKDTSGVTYTIVGFLKKNSFYISPFEGKNAVSLDRYILAGWEVDDEDPVSLICDIKNSLYIDENEMLPEIIGSVKHKLWDFWVVSLKEQMKQCVRDIENELLTVIVFGLVIGIFSTVGILSYMSQFMEKRYREFAIHMLCGAQSSDILLRASLQIGLTILVAIITDFFVFGIDFCTLIVLFLTVIYGMFVSVYLHKKIKESSIVKSIRNGSM